MTANIDARACPVCGHKMKRSGGRRCGLFRRWYRSCPSCERTDTILVQPEQVVSVRVVRRRTVVADHDAEKR